MLHAAILLNKLCIITNTKRTEAGKASNLYKNVRLQHAVCVYAWHSLYILIGLDVAAGTHEKGRSIGPGPDLRLQCFALLRFTLFKEFRCIFRAFHLSPDFHYVQSVVYVVGRLSEHCSRSTMPTECVTCVNMSTITRINIRRCLSKPVLN